MTLVELWTHQDSPIEPDIYDGLFVFETALKIIWANKEHLKVDSNISEGEFFAFKTVDLVNAVMKGAQLVQVE